MYGLMEHVRRLSALIARTSVYSLVSFQHNLAQTTLIYCVGYKHKCSVPCVSLRCENFPVFDIMCGCGVDGGNSLN